MLLKLVTGKWKRGTGNRARGTGHGARGTGHGARGTGHGAQGTGNREPETGVWQLVYSGNSPENSKWRTKETFWGNVSKFYGCKREF